MNPNDRWTILLIDNDSELLRALTKRLGALGFLCLTATSGARGLEEFHGARVDVVVSDLDMPDGDGVELAEKIRETSDVPLIFITGHRDDFRRRLRSVTNVSTLRKPFDHKQLLELISSALGESVA